MRPRLFAFELAWADAAFDAIYPDPPEGAEAAADRRALLPHGIGTMGPSRFLDDLLFAAPAEQSFGLRLALWIVALSPLFAIGRLGTIASISPNVRTRVLERLLSSRIYAVRQLVLGLKAMGALLYARSKSVRARMLEPLTLRPRISGALIALRRSAVEDRDRLLGSKRESAHEQAAE